MFVETLLAALVTLWTADIMVLIYSSSMDLDLEAIFTLVVDACEQAQFRFNINQFLCVCFILISKFNEAIMGNIWSVWHEINSTIHALFLGVLAIFQVILSIFK